MESLGIPDLGPFKLVQAAFFIAIVGSAVLAWVRGARRREAEPREGGVQVYVDGPIQAALGFLKMMADSAQGMYRTLNELRLDYDRVSADASRRKEAELDILRDIRDGHGRPAPKKRRRR